MLLQHIMVSRTLKSGHEPWITSVLADHLSDFIPHIMLQIPVCVYVSRTSKQAFWSLYCADFKPILTQEIP